MQSKSDRVRSLVAAGDFKAALQIAKGFRLGIAKADADDMRRGYECMTNPKFYQSIGMDPREIAQKGVETVIRLYGT